MSFSLNLVPIFEKMMQFDHFSFGWWIRMVRLVGVIDIILVSILIKKIIAPLQETWRKRTKLHQFLKIKTKLRLKKTRAPTWHFLTKKYIKRVIQPKFWHLQNIGWTFATTHKFSQLWQRDGVIGVSTNVLLHSLSLISSNKYNPCNTPFN